MQAAAGRNKNKTLQFMPDAMQTNFSCQTIRHLSCDEVAQWQTKFCDGTVVFMSVLFGKLVKGVVALLFVHFLSHMKLGNILTLIAAICCAHYTQKLVVAVSRVSRIFQISLQKFCVANTRHDSPKNERHSQNTCFFARLKKL